MVGAMIRRLIVYRLLRYRFAWLAFGLLGCYLTAVIVLVVATRDQATAGGALVSCRRDAMDTTAVAFTVRGHENLVFKARPEDFQPLLPATFCAASNVQVLYETDAWTHVGPVDAIHISGEVTGSQTIINVTRGDFGQTKAVQLALLGGGMSLTSGAMLGVALFWGRVGHMVSRRQPKRHAKRHAKGGRLVPEDFASAVAEDLRWLGTLPWGIGGMGSSPAETQQRFDDGLAQVRGWRGDEGRMLRGVELLVGLPPVLSWTGAAEAALQIGAYDVGRFAPEAVLFAQQCVEKALALDPDNADARICEAHVLAARAANGEKPALVQAEGRLRELRALKVDHPRLPVASAAVHMAARRWSSALLPLRTGIAAAPSTDEADYGRLLLAQALARGKRQQVAEMVLSDLRARDVVPEDTLLPPARWRFARSRAMAVRVK